MRYPLIILISLFLLSCKTDSKKKSLELISKKERLNTQQVDSSFQLFIKNIPQIKLPIDSKDFEYLLKKEKTEEDPHLFLYTMDQNKLNDDLMIYNTGSYEFNKFKNTKSYKVKNFKDEIANNNLHNYALERYSRDAENYNDNIFFNIPILRFKYENTYVIGFLTVVASENDNSYADIKLNSYTNEGKLLIDKESDIRDGISLIYSFSGEMGIINIFSSVSKQGIVKTKKIYFDEEGKSEENNQYQITAEGFIPISLQN